MSFKSASYIRIGHLGLNSTGLAIPALELTLSPYV